MLISLLLPSLGLARESARDVTCKSNMRQIYLGSLMFAQENGQRWPRWARIGEASQHANAPLWERTTAWLMYGNGSSGQSAGVADFEVGCIWRYISPTVGAREGIVKCPSDDSSDPMRLGGVILPHPTRRNFSYSLNALISVSGDVLPPKVPKAIYQGVKMSEVIKPTEKIMIFEEMAPNDGFCSRPDTFDAATGDVPSGRHGKKRRQMSGSGGIKDLNGQGNYCFFDGHVEGIPIDGIVGARNLHKYDPIVLPK